MTLQTFLSYVLYDLGKPADWQHVINDAAYSYNYSYVGYQEADNYCRKNGGKVFEPTETTNNPVSKWAQDKVSSKWAQDKVSSEWEPGKVSSRNYIWLGIKWSKKHSQFQYQSDATRIGWSNFKDTKISISSCGDQLCIDDDAAVEMDLQGGKWIVSRRSGSYNSYLRDWDGSYYTFEDINKMAYTTRSRIPYGGNQMLSQIFCETSVS